MNLTRSLAQAAAIAALLCCVESHADLLKPREVDKIPHAAPDKVVSYGNDPSQFGELRLPAGKGPFPVAIVIHGGCWMKFADLLNTAPMADALRNAGVATWNIEYRRVDQQGGGWPGTFHDIAAATDHLRTLAGRYNLDLDRVIAVGHSAGGHLALWTASRHRLAQQSLLYAEHPLRLRGAINLAGPVDLASFPAERQKSVCGAVPIEKLLGGRPDEVPQRSRDASPSAQLPLGVPQILITGSLDALVPASFGEEYASVARERGDRVEMKVIEGAGHFELIAPTTAAWPIVQSAVVSLLRQDE